jgi:hypothetical protein
MDIYNWVNDDDVAFDDEDNVDVGVIPAAAIGTPVVLHLSVRSLIVVEILLAWLLLTVTIVFLTQRMTTHWQFGIQNWAWYSSYWDPYSRCLKTLNSQKCLL